MGANRRRFRISRAGTAGIVMTGILAATAAGAVLPTGSMLTPRPKGPSRADLPSATATSAYRVPTEVAYGLAGHTNIPRPAAAIASTQGLREKAGYVRLSDVPDRPPAPVGKPVPVCQAFVAVCPVILRDERRAVTPKPQFSSVFEGQRYRFSSAEAQARFEADPRRYAPVAGGQDVVLAAKGAEEALGSLKFAGFYQDRLYLFQSQESARAFHANPAEFVGEQES